MTETRPNTQRLGLIIPKVAGAGFNRVEDPETQHYDWWMQRFGFPSISTVEAYAEANGRHDIESVYDTGREDKLAAAVRELSEADCDVVAWPCTCGSFVGGLEWSRAQADAMVSFV